MKRFYILLSLLFFFSIAIADEATINLVYFDSDAKYAPGSGVSVVINPTGVFDINNTFSLELVDANDNLVATLASVQEFYVPVINGVIPGNTAVGSYKLRINSSSPDTSILTEQFEIVNGSVAVPIIETNLSINNKIGYVNCINEDGLLIFGKLTLDNEETTKKPFNNNNYKIDFTGDTIFCVEVASGKISKLTRKGGGGYKVSDDLTYGAYAIVSSKSEGDVISYNSALFLFVAN
ncbi:MAG: hypothetical protein II670_12410, partial [Alphaproteobacteria bacterium]|nr:hypothetical protein [Alphaproteobacteria bacterium]